MSKETMVYIASRFRNKPIVREISGRLSVHGIRALHSWTEEPEGCAPHVAAQRDLDEIVAADAIVVVTIECEAVPGGMHFEAGYAHALGKEVFLIGEPVNIFYKMPSVRKCESVDRAISRILAWAERDDSPFT